MSSVMLAVAGQEFESLLDESLRIERDEVGLVAVNALVVGGVVARAGFFWIDGQIAGSARRLVQEPTLGILAGTSTPEIHLAKDGISCSAGAILSGFYWSFRCGCS